MSDYHHDIERYLKGELTPEERHALEKKALSDPFLADALEGAEQINAEEFVKDVEYLNKEIAKRKRTSLWIWPMRIAAGLAIIAVSSFLVWQVFENQSETKDLAMEQNNPSPIVPAHKDSISTVPSETQALSEQATSGPVEKRDKVVPKTADESKAKVKTETQPTQLAIQESSPQSQPKPEADAMIAEETKTEELKVTEPVAAVRQIETIPEKAMVKEEEISRAKKPSLAARKDKGKEEAPSALGYAANSTKIIRGKVTSAEDGSSLPGVNVIIKGTTIGTVTDAEGNYQIEINQSNPTLVYAFIGLKSTEVEAKGKTTIDVTMGIDATELSEVVVTALGSESDDDKPLVPITADLAHPTIGFKSFKLYLQQNVRYPEEAKRNKVEGRVTIEFTVETNGSLSNFNILHGIGSGCDDELIRLIKEGPQWIPTKRDNVPVQDKVKVRLKFELPK